VSLDQQVSAEDDQRVRFEVLGRLRVLDGTATDRAPGHGLRLGGAQQQLVLAVLIARANTVVPTDALVEDLWGASPPAAARHTVQGYVSELRKLLGPVIARDGPGYVVHADARTLDALEFEALVRRGRDALPGNPAAASTSLTAALRLWRGEAFEGLDDADAVASERVRLEQLRLAVVEERVGADLALGRHRQVVAELEGLTREHPFHEELRAQHMPALYRSGRQADALRAFQQARTGLVEQLGLEPSPLLRRLEEQVLVQDPALDLVRDGDDASLPAGAASPYVGLRAFSEADAEVFHGREGLIARLMDAVRGPSGLTALVGPSGSGKSSIVQAGVVPALRGLSGPGTEWTIALMRPGANPFTELEAALFRAVETPAVSLGLLWRPQDELACAVLGLLPDGAPLLLVVDQFEELFTLVDDRQRAAFLRGLVALATGAQDRCHVLVTLRADFYDRPLAHPGFGRLMSGRVVDVLPLAPDELEGAALMPAAAAGASFERGLLAALIADVSGQPNALPLFQYTLSKLFDRRSGSTLTLAAYRELGGIRGAVAQGAEEAYQRLDQPQQQATHQLFLRLVSVRRDSETRRVVTASELVALDVDTVTLHGAVEAFVAARLLVRDRDTVTGSLTVEVAHEALLGEWERLRRWVDEGRDDLREHAVLTLALEDWLTAGNDPDYLLTAARLDRFEQWAATTGMRLTTSERDFLDQARLRRDDAVAAEFARMREQGQLRRRARTRAFVLGAGASATAAAVVAAAVVAASTANPPGIAIAQASPTSAAEYSTIETSYFAGSDVDVTVSMPAGWYAADVVVEKRGADPVIGLAFYDVGNIYADPCRWGLLDPPVGPTVDDLVAAISTSSVYDVGEARDVKVDGYPGTHLEFTVPDYDSEDCTMRRFLLWTQDGSVLGPGDGTSLWAQAPGQRMDMWVLDVNGTRLVVAAGSHPDTAPEDVAAMEAMVSSMQIG